MNLVFSEDHQALRDIIRKRLAERPARDGLEAIEAGASHDAARWQALAEDGWLGAAFDDVHGGSGLGPHALCVLAEEIGRAAPALPFTASICGFGTAMALLGGEPAGQWLPRIASGEVIGLCMETDAWATAPQLADDGETSRLDGHSHAVLDGAAADVALCLAGEGDAARLLLLDLRHASVDREIADPHRQLDPLHPAAWFRFTATPAQTLLAGAEAAAYWRRLRDHRAVYGAFEQLGGAAASLDMARAYSHERRAFNRAIGSFQGLKHMMADMLAALELARANAHYAAAALTADDGVLAEAAAVAHLAACEAYALCARQNIQIHGGIGVTWESDAHLHYRRARVMAAQLGPARQWPERLVALLEARADAATPEVPA